MDEVKPVIEVKYTEPSFGPPADTSTNLEDLFGSLPMVTAIPTLIPQIFRQTISLDSTTGIVYYYDSTNHVWKSTASSARRVQSVTSASTVTPNADTDDCVDITALAAAVTIAAPTGTPTNFQKLIIRFKDNATARAITWNAAFTAGGVALPSTTVISKILHCGFFYNTNNSKWMCVASSQES